MNSLAHAKVLLQSKEILKNDGHNTFAYVAGFHESDLLRGTAYADDAGVKQYIDIDLRSIISFGASLYTWRIDLSNTSSFTHYYDPNTGQGLDLSAYGDVEGFVEAGGFLAAIVLGFAGFWIDASAHPDLNFNVPYQSAADACQEHYDLAVITWRNPQAGSYPMADAMYHLGWACHFLADLSTSAHTTSSRFLNHQDYEDLIDVVQGDNAVHAQGISGNLAQYNLGASVRQIAAECATETAQELYLYDQKRWDEGARLAIPRAERYSARILAKFFYDVGVAQMPLPLRVNVRTTDETPIPNAVVFYRKPGQKWKPLITDNQGSTHVVPQSNEVLEFRPSVPGYLFEGVYGGVAPTIPEFPNYQSPVRYTHSPDPIQEPSIVFRLRPMAPIFRVAVLDRAALLTHFGTITATLRPVAPHFARANPTEAAIAETINVEVMGERPGTEPELKVDSPIPAHIRVSIYSLINVMTGQLVRSRDDLEHLVATIGDVSTPERLAGYRERRVGIRRAEARQPVQPTAEAQEAMARTAEMAARSQERLYTGQKLRWKDPGLATIPTIFVRAPGRHRVQVEFIQEVGFVGYHCQDANSIEVRTNAYEEAWIRILTGNQAGRLKLKITVTPEDVNHGFGEITKFVELWVMPSDAGAVDTEPLRAPRLEAV
jgi:hypothetical protein